MDPAAPLKFVGPDTIEGPAFRFGVKDAHGETFLPETDLCIPWFGKSGRPLLYEHGLDPALRAGIIGRQIDYEEREGAIWAQSQLEANAKYRKQIDALIESGALAYSPGAMAHLARKDSRSGAIKQFPWVELTLTPTAAQLDIAPVHYLKSATALEHLEAVDVDIPAPLKAALTALDDWAETRDDSPAESYAKEGERVLLAARAFADRSFDIAAMRAKSGRVLSAANRERLTQLRERIAASSEHASVVLKDLDELLASTDPEAAAGKSARFVDELIRAYAVEARLLGADIPLETTGAPA